MNLQYYPIKSQIDLETFVQSYLPLISYQLSVYGIDPIEYGIKGDHLGLQLLSKEEFDNSHKLLIHYSKVINEGVIHKRRNNTYLFNDYIIFNDIEIQSIEIFEPKPDADLNKLKPGIEHIAFYVKEYDKLFDYCVKNNIPIDKSVDYDGSKFFKTRLINMVEIEFRNDYLWKSLANSR